ncbi:adenosine 5'-monophosphoramidase HINT3-like [Phlebotomus argentipes]|uniref:adenosine 5'-monophosphoramidase HINT3-like n=1 Tax=Phlebotomus argentipes TaxID=94469 RepID=UPI00289344FC|nr:adenosine 5'-monophosphoramidase HINT3-like [Phlebotomus argentipes]
MQTVEKNCIFCKIVRKEDSKTVIEHESDNIVIFKDIKPATEFHYLAVPKRHIKNCKELTMEHKPLLDEMKESLEQLLAEKGVNVAEEGLLGFHWPPFNSVKHLHMHGMGPRSRMGVIGKLIFKPNNKWFCTNDHVFEWLRNQPSSS